MLELPLLSAGAVAAGAGRGGKVPLLERQSIKIGELFTILEMKNYKKTYLPYKLLLVTSEETGDFSSYAFPSLL